MLNSSYIQDLYNLVSRLCWHSPTLRGKLIQHTEGGINYHYSTPFDVIIIASYNKYNVMDNDSHCLHISCIIIIIIMYIRQVTRAQSKRGAVVKHQRVFVVLKDHISCKTAF